MKHYEIRDAPERNPEDGRFLTEDTYRGETNEPDTWHLYVYCKNNPVNYVDPSGHSSTPYIYEKVYGQYWYHANDKVKFGKKGSVEYAKKKTDGHLKKYKAAIRAERKSASKAQKMLGNAVLLTIIDFGTAKFSTLIKAAKVSKKIPSYILGKITGKVSKGINNIAKVIVGGGILSNARSGVSALKVCYSKHQTIKSEYSKISRKKKGHF